MWDVPRYRVRAYLRSVRASKQRERERKERSQYHMKQVRAELRIGDSFNQALELLTAKVVLNDVTHQGMKLFVNEPLLPGTQVSLTIEEPRYFYAKANVLWCHPVTLNQRVLHREPLNFRVGLEFLFSSMTEQMAIRNYCQTIFVEHLNLPDGPL